MRKLFTSTLSFLLFCGLLLPRWALAENRWIPCGWGGGGFYYAAAFHPTRDGVIYLGGDVNGAYKSEDHGRTWRIINKGIAGYGIFAFAVDPSTPDTVWAATDDGLCKSTDAGETWQTITKSGPKELRLTGEKNRSIHNVAVDPTDGKIVYVGTPHGKIYKSTDGGANWTLLHSQASTPETVPSQRFQFGKVNGGIYGGLWLPLKFPATIAAGNATGIGFSLKNQGLQPRDVFFSIRTSTGVSYRSRNLHDLFKPGDWRDVVLTAADFVIDPEWKAKDPQKGAAAPATPEWSTVNRFDLAAVGGLENDAAVVWLSRIFIAASKTTDGQTGTAEKPVLVTAIDLTLTKSVPVYGNLAMGERSGGAIYSVVVSPHDPKLIAAASADEGLLISRDAGQTWQAHAELPRVTSLAFCAGNPQIIYAACKQDHVWKSTDQGKTWTKAATGILEKMEVLDLVVSPKNADEVTAIGIQGWNGRFFRTQDGGKSWTVSDKVTPDPQANPNLPVETANRAQVALSAPRNIAVNPQNPRELFVAANWRSTISRDGGQTWAESSRGADISCVADIRFVGNRVYTASMDEGVMASDDNGASWKQLWPLKYSNELSGHAWRLDVREVNGMQRILSTSSPWDRPYNQLVISQDGGKTFQAFRQGLPDYIPTANTNWGRAYIRALAVDPHDPNIVYVGLDGDPTDGKSGGGIFKSTDGGKTWKQLPQQPASRRTFFGLAVDPTNSQRLYWGACGDKGGLYRSEDAGATWQRVFGQEQWIFNLHVTADGTVYSLGKQIYRSTDHGQTWKSLAKLPTEGIVVGFEVHPTDAKTMWAVANHWGGPSQLGGVYKTTDGGKSWTDLTLDLPFRRPLVLRFNPQTSELWAGNVGLYRIKQ